MVKKSFNPLFSSNKKFVNPKLYETGQWITVPITSFESIQKTTGLTDNKFDQRTNKRIGELLISTRNSFFKVKLRVLRCNPIKQNFFARLVEKLSVANMLYHCIWMDILDSNDIAVRIVERNFDTVVR